MSERLQLGPDEAPEDAFEDESKVVPVENSLLERDYKDRNPI